MCSEELELFRSVSSVMGDLVRVVEAASVRSLYLSELIQSDAIVEADGTISFAQPDEHVPLLLALALAWLEHGAAARMLLCGVGGGNVMRCIARLIPLARVHGVELEPEVLEAAIKYFGLELGELITAEVDDARAFLKRCASAIKGRSESESEVASSEHERQEYRTESRATMSTPRNEHPSDDAKPFDVLMIDCFSGEGLAEAVLNGSALRHAAACLTPVLHCGEQDTCSSPCATFGGLCIVNLHTARGKEAMGDTDYIASKKVSDYRVDTPSQV